MSDDCVAIAIIIAGLFIGGLLAMLVSRMGV
jgi:hypothetical protein